MKISKSSLIIILSIISGISSVFWLKNPQILAQSNPQNRSIIYVNAQQGLDYEDAGSSLERPFRSITYALKYAQQGTTIQLASGQYTNENFPIELKNGVILRGSPANKGSDILISGGGDTITRSYALQNITILANQNSQVTGITVTNPNNRGTGIWIESGNPIISNNSFIKNNREGVFVSGIASPIIENNQFINNFGNGMALGKDAKGQIVRNSFDDTGFAIAMGGKASPFMISNHIKNNRSGVVLTEQSQPILQDNVIENNYEYGLIAISKSKPDIKQGNQIKANGENIYLVQSNPENLNVNTASGAIQFECVQQEKGYATVVKRNDPSILPRNMILWTRTVGEDWTPEKRCQEVTNNLNKIVANNNGQIDNLAFTVNRGLVCLASTSSLGCNDQNRLFTLSQTNAQKPQEIIAQLSASIGSASGSSSPVLESNGNPYALLSPLNQKLQPESGLWFANY
jgi:parallel beta-helix repeat protein